MLYKCSLGLKDELMRMWWSNVKVTVPSSLKAHVLPREPDVSSIPKGNLFSMLRKYELQWINKPVYCVCLCVQIWYTFWCLITIFPFWTSSTLLSLNVDTEALNPKKNRLWGMWLQGSAPRADTYFAIFAHNYILFTLKCSLYNCSSSFKVICMSSFHPKGVGRV